MEEKEVIESKICCACQKLKKIKDYYVNRALKSGYDNKCKMCRLHGRLCRKKDTPKRPKPKKREINLTNVTKEDWVETYLFLEKIGYDITNDLHHQFCERHGLKPRKRMKEKTLYFSPKDLGMI